MTQKPILSFIINDNEKAAKDAFARGDYLQAFLLIHTLLESLLRMFLNEMDDRTTFAALISKYEQFLNKQNYPIKTLVKELREFNKRRNRIIHELWKKGYSYTNRQAKSASNTALMLYGLSIEFLETWNSEMKRIGFRYT